VPGTFAMGSFTVHNGEVAGLIRDENNGLYSIESLGNGMNACYRRPYGSNPNVNFNNIPTGTAATHNNARVLKNGTRIIWM